MESSEAAEGVQQQQLQYNSRKVFQFMHEIVTAMAPHHPDISLRLFLECTQVRQADRHAHTDRQTKGRRTDRHIYSTDRQADRQTAGGR